MRNSRLFFAIKVILALFIVLVLFRILAFAVGFGISVPYLDDLLLTVWYRIVD